jgi:hypothetical protein
LPFPFPFPFPLPLPLPEPEPDPDPLPEPEPDPLPEPEPDPLSEAELLELEPLPEFELLLGVDAALEPDPLPEPGVAKADIFVAAFKKVFCTEPAKAFIPMTSVRLISIRSNAYSVVPCPSFSFQNLFQILFIQLHPFVSVFVNVRRLGRSTTGAGAVHCLHNNRYNIYWYKQLLAPACLAVPTSFAPTLLWLDCFQGRIAVPFQKHSTAHAATEQSYRGSNTPDACCKHQS